MCGFTYRFVFHAPPVLLKDTTRKLPDSPSCSRYAVTAAVRIATKAAFSWAVSAWSARMPAVITADSSASFTGTAACFFFSALILGSICSLGSLGALGTLIALGFFPAKTSLKMPRIAQRIATMLENAGFKVELSACSDSKFQKNLKNRNFDLCLLQTKLSPNMDLSPFFDTYGSLSYGKINDTAMYALCKEALANHGNYYTLHQTVMNDGRLCPILFRSYAIYATRGLLTELTPTRDNVFFYTLGKTMESAKLK